MYAVMLSMVCVAIVSVIGIFGVVEVLSYTNKFYPDFKSYIVLDFNNVFKVFTHLLNFQEKSGLLLLFTIFLVCMFLFHLVAAIVITVWGVEESPVLIKELRDVFLDLVYGWDVDPRKSRIFRQIMEYVSSAI